MRKLNTILLLTVCLSVASYAQSFDYHRYYHDIDLYDGLDQSFYKESSFGVKNSIYSAYPVAQMVRYNRVDGLFLGYQEDKMDWNKYNNLFDLPDINLNGMLGYSFGQKAWQYSIGLEKNIGSSHKWLMLGGNLYNSTTTEDYWRTGQTENSVTSFFTGFDYQDYYKADGYGFYGLLKPTRAIELGASYNWDNYNTLDANTDFSLISKYAAFRPNPGLHTGIDNIYQETLTLGLVFKSGRIAPASNIKTTVSINAELADIGQAKNDFSYNKYQAEAKTYLRLDKSTLFKWRVMAGSAIGDVPEFKNFALGGLGSMRALGYKAMQGNEMLLSNLELQFGRTSTTKLGWVNLQDLSASVFLDSGASKFNGAFLADGNPISDYSMKFSDLSHNIGFGFGINTIKFEFAKPLSGMQGQSAFWIRFNPTF